MRGRSPKASRGGFAGRTLALVVGWLVLVWAGQACSPSRVTTYSQPGLSQARVVSLGVMPFLKGRHPTDVRKTLNCRLRLLSYDPDHVIGGAEWALTRYVDENIRARFGKRVIPHREVLVAYEKVPKDELNDTPLTLAARLGRSLGANLMILGTVWRYKERVGGPGGASRAASVAFDLYLVDVSEGKMLWMANFDETQRSLSENVLDAPAFFSRGARWLSANELARYGVKSALRKLPL